MTTKTRKPSSLRKHAVPKQQIVRQSRLKHGEQFLEPLPIDKMRAITIAGRDFVAIAHINASPKLWTWQLEDGALCWFAFQTRKGLLRDGKPSPGAKPVRVRIVKC